MSLIGLEVRQHLCSIQETTRELTRTLDLLTRASRVDGSLRKAVRPVCAVLLVRFVHGTLPGLMTAQAQVYNSRKLTLLEKNDFGCGLHSILHDELGGQRSHMHLLQSMLTGVIKSVSQPDDDEVLETDAETLLQSSSAMRAYTSTIRGMRGSCAVTAPVILEAVAPVVLRGFGNLFLSLPLDKSTQDQVEEWLRVHIEPGCGAEINHADTVARLRFLSCSVCAEKLRHAHCDMLRDLSERVRNSISSPFPAGVVVSNDLKSPHTAGAAAQKEAPPCPKKGAFNWSSLENAADSSGAVSSSSSSA